VPGNNGRTRMTLQKKERRGVSW